ncbi:uncharacterized protein UV8b_04387 [Ustilaginoidea virens]|uniref:Chitin biosynthesis protein CHS5 n=1 Tax=Ustilaginoidea virens TaxID=1159556 RepID=A0A1B5L484_USTVR|nr:uncharacterized protein UV8b_04387 [Ustilaginoidea virens]QUC20146.1 hypothetical protein UV8b_04387 [Ustilaginoidea virens]GAO18322.1 hypothetical protein UVI_02032890 [Ustilaginoidea virens]
MLVSLTVGKVDAGVTVLLTPDKRLIEFPSILLPPNISSGSIVDIAVSQNVEKETAQEQKFRALQHRILHSFGASEPASPALRCRNATQTAVVLEWDPVELATADLISLSLYRNGQKAGNIPRPLHMHSTKISGLAVDTEYTFHLVLRTTAGVRTSDKMAVRTHKMTDLSGITITPGILPAAARETLCEAVERIGAKLADGVRIDTTHFVTTEGRGAAWEKAVENNIPVVRPEWVDACEKNGRILGVTRFYLDAMMPGPPSDDQLRSPPPPPPPPPVPAKDMAQSPPPSRGATTTAAAATTADDEVDAADAGSGKTQGTTAHGNDQEQGQQESSKAPPHPDEQKMKLEEKAEQKVALRPSSSSKRDMDMDADKDVDMAMDGDAEPTGKGDEHGDEENGTEGQEEKPAGTPDGASFQEVEL